MVDVRQYTEGQTGNRGFLGLAALIFGNWMPMGVALGAWLFSYGISLGNAVGTEPVKALYLFMAGVFVALSLVLVMRRHREAPRCGLLISGLALITFYFNTHQVNDQIVYITPYIIVLVVITFASKRSLAGNRRHTVAPRSGRLSGSAAAQSSAARSVSNDDGSARSPRRRA